MPAVVLPEPFDVLLARARSGDEHAFEALHREHAPRVARYLQVHAPDTAQDTAADAWYEVARAIHRFDGNEIAFRAWVFTIVRRKVIDQVRRDARQRLVTVPDDPREAADDDVADVAARAEETRAAIARVRTPRLRWWRVRPLDRSPCRLPWRTQPRVVGCRPAA